jgi:hypothetical protein
LGNGCIGEAGSEHGGVVSLGSPRQQIVGENKSVVSVVLYSSMQVLIICQLAFLGSAC